MVIGDTSCRFNARNPPAAAALSWPKGHAQPAASTYAPGLKPEIKPGCRRRQWAKQRKHATAEAERAALLKSATIHLPAPTASPSTSMADQVGGGAPKKQGARSCQADAVARAARETGCDPQLAR